MRGATGVRVRRKSLRLGIAMLAVLVAVATAAAARATHIPGLNHDPSKITATCFASESPTGSFSSTNPIVLWQGADLYLSLGYRNNDTGASAVYNANFTTTISATTSFGASRTIDTSVQAGGQGLSRGTVKLFQLTSVAPATEQVVISITSDATDATVLASCNFQVTVKPIIDDIDGDGITNTLEQTGLRDGAGNLVLDADGDPAADFPALGANPCRKDLFVEVDYQGAAADGHDHRPAQQAVDDVTAAFDDAPITAQSGGCPFAGYQAKNGIHIGVVVDDALPAETTSTDANGNTVINGVDCSTRSLGRFDPARRPYFLYSMWVHTLRGDSTSGEGPCSDGRSFMVSLGYWSGQNGTLRDQAGTFMHELGHLLGLGHGGDSGINLKPNYLSVMNYSFQTDARVPLDYSRSALPELDETTLDENAGIAGPSSWKTKWWGPQPTFQYPSVSTPLSAANGKLDWNQNGSFNSSVSVDVNHDGPCVGPGPNKTRDTSSSGDDVVSGPNLWNGPNHACDTRPSGDDVQAPGTDSACVLPGANGTLDTTPTGDDATGAWFSFKWVSVGANRVCDTTAAGDDFQFTFVGRTEPRLTGFDDWGRIDWRIGPSKAAPSPGALPPVLPHLDLTEPEARAIAAAANPSYDFDLDVWVTVNDANPTPGDVLTFTWRVENVGTGTASRVSAAVTPPGGASQAQTLPDLLPGQGQTFQTSYAVPSSAADKSTVQLSVTASGTNLLGGAENVFANNTRTATATVHTPVLTLAKSGPAVVLPGSGATFTLTYANAGTGEGRSVTVTDTLPAGISYSLALDQGSGPRPDAVVANADGTTTLSWSVGTLAASSGPRQIVFSARPTLLATDGSSVTNAARLSFTDKNANAYAPLTATAVTMVGTVVPSRDPQGHGFWGNTGAPLLTPEVLASIQTTDPRFDGAGRGIVDGVLTPSEAAAVLDSPTGAQVLRVQLFATYANLATRRIGGGTRISSRTASLAGATTVTGAIAYAVGALAGTDASARERATRLLDEINTNKSEEY